MLIPLSLIKKQCVVDEWYTDDDEYLKSLAQAAISIVENEIDQPINQVIAKNDGKLPVGLQQCILLLIDYFYSSNRGSEQTDIPPAFLHLCAIYRNWGSTR